MRATHTARAAHPRPRLRLRLRGSLAALALLGPTLLGTASGDPGEAIPLSGNGPGERLDVTLVQVVDPASPAPDDADRLVAVQLRLENTGSVVYEDSPALSSHLLDGAGERFTGLNASTPAGPAFPESVTLHPRDTAVGFVTFRLPKDAALAAVQFAMNGGLSDDVGQWSLS